MQKHANGILFTPIIFDNMLKFINTHQVYEDIQPAGVLSDRSVSYKIEDFTYSTRYLLLENYRKYNVDTIYITFNGERIYIDGYKNLSQEQKNQLDDALRTRARITKLENTVVSFFKEGHIK